MNATPRGTRLRCRERAPPRSRRSRSKPIGSIESMDAHVRAVEDVLPSLAVRREIPHLTDVAVRLGRPDDAVGDDLPGAVDPLAAEHHLAVDDTAVEPQQEAV